MISRAASPTLRCWPSRRSSPRPEFRKIKSGLKSILKEIETGCFPFKTELEDIHMNIEGRLFEMIGDTAGKLHTARSRNDQVALDMRLFATGLGHAIGQSFAAAQFVAGRAWPGKT